MRIRRWATTIVACFVGGALLAPPASHAETPELAGAYEQITADGDRVDLGFGGAEQAVAAYAAIYRVTGDDEHRRTLDALLNYILAERPGYMGTYFGRQVLGDPYLRAQPRLIDNVDAYVQDVVDQVTADRDSVLRQGDIRTLSGRADLLLEYAQALADDANGGSRPADDMTKLKIRRIDRVATLLLDRVADLQLTYDEAAGRFGNDRLTGSFPHFVTGDDGSMGSWDVATWAPAMLSLDSYLAIEALADGFGRYHAERYDRAAAAGARQLLATEDVESDLLYAGSPPGFPLDGASFEQPEETGEHLYLTTYGWSPNAIAQLGSALRALADNRVTVPRSPTWLRVHWRGQPPESVLDPAAFWRGLDAKVAYTHDFLEAAQLPVPADFPWLDLDRASYPGTGTEPFRQGGWYDGSGRGTMSAVYARLTTVGYVNSGGADVDAVRHMATWWDGMLVWR